MSQQPDILPISPKVRSRQDRTRRRIMNESARLFIERGFENVSVEDIIAASEVARSSFYRFFDNREDLLSQIVRPVFERGRRLLLDARGHNPRALLEHVFETYLALWRDSPDALRVSTRVGGVDFSLFRDAHDAYRQALEPMLEAAEQAGILLNGNARLTGSLIARNSIRVLETYAGEPDLDRLFLATMRGMLLLPVVPDSISERRNAR